MAEAMAEESERAAFLRTLKRGSVSHAYIVEGAPGIGKKEFALWCASALLCTGADKPCGVCAACRKVAGGHHPDVHLFGDDGKAVSVGDVRELIRVSGLVPAEGERSVFILCGGQKMLAPAQNALLKILEEPPPGTVIFLLTENRRTLLPTVRSRGQTVVLRGKSEEELLALLRRKAPGVPEEELADAARAADGSPGRAEAFLQKDARQNRERTKEWLSAALAGDRYALLSLVAVPKYKRENLLPLLDCFLRRLSGLLTAKVRGGTASDPDGFLSRTTRRALSGMIGATVLCRESIESNGNITAVMTRFATELWRCATFRRGGEA